MKFQVAIIGSPGSGKTVLTAVLSRYLSGHADRVYMNPKGAYRYTETNVETLSTISYVNGMLDTLHNGKWPQGTEQNQKFELGFELHISGNTYGMKLLDSPGEDLKAIWTNYDRTALRSFQKKLFDYILSSNVVVLIVNLDHFADATSFTEKGENENVLKEAVDNLVQGGVCHYVLVCFTAYDKYKATIDQTYGGNFINYLREELPMFFRSCQVAGAKVVHDYTEHGYGQKKILLDCIALAPVIEQRPTPGMNPDRFGKPPIGFDIKNPRHSWGIKQIADWLCKCEQWERHWNQVAEKVEGGKETHDFLLYRIAPIVIGAIVGVLSWLVLTGGIAGHTIITVTRLVNSLFWGMPIGAAIGFLVGDKLKVLVTKKDGFLFKKDRGEKDEQQEEPTTSRPTGTGGTSTASSRSSGTGGTSTPPPRSSGTSGTSTPPPRPSGTGGTAASSGSETFD